MEIGVKALLLLIFGTHLFHITDVNGDSTLPEIVENNCKPYFEFDSLEHYSIEIDLTVLNQLEKSTDTLWYEKKFVEIVTNPAPMHLEDSTFEQCLRIYKARKKHIVPSKYEDFNSIFCERKHDKHLLAACKANYLDVLVFYQGSKKTGIAKICFHCGKSKISGTLRNVNEFGQSGDFEKLKKLLQEK